ncbi:manganese efflux pump [Pseudodesulfovibrio sp. F-1]|uniref:Putative manganese efflux pump MntP n=1 Tax=Pseudodesulfovibrio alkaliphilus TaxID=2661613 RepID=A0A7K1KLB2_9BACT|nr:manganese efflux pump MntP family protein [Pseudodesulfovibrio alkaliphilus]MUM76741.1 manganese efflux pump [Pseudodesulfovibrio alkaliphilus]
MGTAELVTIAIVLAMDAFAVAIATGVALKAVSLRQTFRLSWHFGLFQALMPVIGWHLGITVRESIEAYDHWVAFVLLGYIGYKMIREAFDEEEASKGDPTRGMSLIALSVATSIDALAVGLSLSVLGVSIWWPSAVIGIVALLFTMVGLQAGKTAVRAKCLGKYAEILGGTVLVGIGVGILWEHGSLTF